MVGYLWLLLVTGCAGTGASYDYRLPEDLLPLSYRLRVEPDLEEGLFTTELRLEFTALRQTSVLLLNAWNLTLNHSSLFLKDSTGKDLGVVTVREEHDLQRIAFLSGVPFAVGNNYTFGVIVGGYINQDGVGLYKEYYVDDVGAVRYSLATQLRPTYARKLFPCMDEPSFRASFVLSVVHNATQSVISSMPVASLRSAIEGKAETLFQSTPKIPAFLLGFVVSDFPNLKNGNFSFYAVPSNLEKGRYALELAPSVVAAMVSHANVSYPYVKTDMVALPALTPVAMENWGLNTYREENILYSNISSTTAQQVRASRFVAHEVSHSLLGNMVSVAFWSDLWLSEGFAMFYEHYLIDKVNPSWGMMDQLAVSIQSGLLSDSFPSPPLASIAPTSQAIAAKFTGLTYTKAPALIRMCISFLTEQDYTQGLRNFLETNAYNSVEGNQFWDALNKRTLPAPLNEIMNSWTTLSGYPVVNVIRNRTTGNLQLTQSMFSLHPNSIINNDKWWIPLSYTTSVEKNFTNTVPTAWFSPESTTVVRLPAYFSATAWYIFNLQMSGFYRVNYDEGNWRNIITTLRTTPLAIATLNRAQLLDDSLNLARGGQLSYKLALDLLQYLTNERDFAPWASGLNAISYLDNVLSQTSLAQPFTTFLGSLLNGVYSNVGFSDVAGETNLRKLLRELVVKWACRTGNLDCIRQSSDYLASLAPRSLNKRVSVDVRKTALCTGVASGGQSEWQLALSLYQTSSDVEKGIFLSSLACTKVKNNLNGFLLTSLNNTNEAGWSKVFSVMAYEKDNAQTLLEFLLSQYATIKCRFGKEILVNSVKKISNFLTTNVQLKMLEDLESLAEISLTYEKKDIAIKASWLEKNLPQLISYLQVNITTVNAMALNMLG